MVQSLRQWGAYCLHTQAPLSMETANTLKTEAVSSFWMSLTSDKPTRRYFPGSESSSTPLWETQISSHDKIFPLFRFLTTYSESGNNIVGAVTKPRPGWPNVRFHSSKRSRSAPGPTQPPIQWLLESYLEAKRPTREVSHPIAPSLRIVELYRQLCAVMACKEFTAEQRGSRGTDLQFL